MKGVVYSMDCAVCGDMYMGEKDRPVRVRYAEHYRDARFMHVRTAWGNHYVDHRESATLPNFAPCILQGTDSREAYFTTLKTIDGGGRDCAPLSSCEQGW